MSPDKFCQGQTFIPAGTSVAELDKVLDAPDIWDHVNFLGAVSSKATTIAQVDGRRQVDISEWFQWQVGMLTGGQVTPMTSPLEIRSKICQIEQLMRGSVDAGEMVDTAETYPLKHTFADGIYVREMSIPAGHMIVGKIHRHDHLNFISKGRVTVITEQGGVEELTGPCTMISPAGVKRLLFTHEDTVWTVAHVTDKTDLDEIEAEVIAASYTAMGWEQPSLQGGKNVKKLT